MNLNKSDINDISHSDISSEKSVDSFHSQNNSHLIHTTNNDHYPENFFKEFYNQLPIGIMEIDISELIPALEEYSIFDKQAFPTNVLVYCEMMKKVIDLIEIVQVNQKILEIFRAKNQSHLDGNYKKIFVPESYTGISDALKQLFLNKETIDFEIVTYDLEGKKKYLHMNLAIKKKGIKFYSRLLLTCIDISIRKETELALAESKEQYSKFIHSSPNNYTLLDSKLNIVTINKSSAKSMGKRQKEIIGKHILDIAPFLERTGRYDLYKNVIRTGKPLFLKEICAEPQNNNYLDIIAFKVGKGLGIITTDVTEKVQLTKELDDSNHSFKIFTESSPIAIMFYKNYRCLYCNPSAETLTGYSFQELSKLSFRDLVHPDYKDSIINSSEQFQLDDFVTNNFEVKIVSKDSKPKWVQIRLKKIDYRGNKVALLSLVDITQLKTIQKKQLTEKEYLSKTLSLIGEGVIATDVDGKITLFNYLAEELTEWYIDEVLNRNIIDIFKLYHENKLEPSKSLIEKITMQSTVVHVGDYTLKTKMGNEKIISLRGTPIRDHDECIIGTVIVFREISEKKKI